MNWPFHWLGFGRPKASIKRAEIIKYLRDMEGGSKKVLDVAQAAEAEDLMTDMLRAGWKRNPRGVIEYLEGR